MIQSLVLSTKNEEERSLVKSKRDKENVKRERERERESSTGKQSIFRRTLHSVLDDADMRLKTKRRLFFRKEYF